MHLPGFWQTFGPLFGVNLFVILALITFAVISRSRPRTAEIEDRHSSMILGRWIREFWFWLTHPIFKFFLYFRVSPNAISIIGTVVAVFAAAAFATGRIGLGGWLMVMGASLDLFDGRVARANNQVTLAGSYIDSCMDRISEALTMAGIVFLYRDSLFFWIAMAALIGSQLTSYTKTKGETMGVDYKGGIMQRPERIVYLGAGAIITPMIAYLLYPVFVKLFPLPTYSTLELYVYLIPIAFVALFSIGTSLVRIVNIMKLLDKKQFGDQNIIQLQSHINSNKNPTSKNLGTTHG